jgi:hypothetical protein
MKVYGGVDVQIHVISTSTLVGGEWSASRSGHLIPGETAPGTHRIGEWMGPRAGLDDVEKGKFLTVPELKLDPLVVQNVASRYTYCAIPAPRLIVDTLNTSNNICRDSSYVYIPEI